MKLNRLFEIILILTNRKKVTAQELADKFNVSVRTIYRDIDVLSASNIPVYTEKGAGGGICLLPEYVMNKTLISEQEQKEIIMGLQSLRATGFKDESTTLEKISNLFKKDSFDWIEVDFSSWGFTDHDMKFNILKEAILKNHKIEFEYYNSYGTKRTRKVSPIRLIFKYRAWYLQAYSLENQDLRLYRITRMLNPRITEEQFEPLSMTKKEIDVSWDAPVKFVEGIFKFKKEFAYRVFDDYNREQIEIDENGDLLVRGAFPDCPWLMEMLLSYGEAVDVIGGDELREKFRGKLETIINKYK